MNLNASERMAIASVALVVLVVMLTYALLTMSAVSVVASAMGLGILLGMILPRALECKT